MLEPVRIETIRITHHKRPPYNQKIYIFECLDCGEEIRKYRKKITHTGKCKSCVRRVNPPYWQTYRSLLYNAKRGDHDVTLTYDEFELFTQIKCCGYCAAEITWIQYNIGPYNLDRKDNNKGYHLNNLIVCCKECNLMKNKFAGFDEFKVIRRALDIAKKSDTDREELWSILVAWNDRYGRVAP